MAGSTEQDIAACLGHSTTALVRRYAHLSPSHLRTVVERVSTFGKDKAKNRKDPRSKVNRRRDNSPVEAPVEVGTVIKPGMTAQEERTGAR